MKHKTYTIAIVPFIFLLLLDIPYLLENVPTQHELLNLLADISHLWQEIGLSLNVSDNVLGGLKQSKERDAVKLAEVINSWLNSSTSIITWKTVIDAIKGPIINHAKKANEIYQHLINSKLIYNIYIYIFMQYNNMYHLTILVRI